MAEIELKNYLVRVGDIAKSGLIPQGSYFRAQCDRDPNVCMKELIIQAEPTKIPNAIYLRCRLGDRTRIYNNFLGILENGERSTQGLRVYCGKEGNLSYENESILKASTVDKI